MKDYYFNILCIAAALVLVPAAFADNPRPNEPHETRSANGRFVIRMEPAAAFGAEGKGVAFEIGEAGEKRLWEVNWFAADVALSDDGRHLVRFGPWATDTENHTDLAVAFYHDGRLLREYRVNELVKEPKAIVYSASHYWWRPEKQSVPTGFAGADRFCLVVADKTVYEFALATGEVKATYKDPLARTAHELFAELREAARLRGMQALRKGEIEQVFGSHFEFADVKAGFGKTSGVHFDEPEWSADLSPKHDRAQPALVEAHFPLQDGDRIDVSVKPEEILAALDRALAHPFIVERFEKRGATGIRLRITGDRLHWNTDKLREFLQKLGHPDKEGAVLTHWAYFIIDAEEPRYQSLYLNVQTGELIYEDESKWPWVPVLVKDDNR